MQVNLPENLPLQHRMKARLYADRGADPMGMTSEEWMNLAIETGEIESRLPFNDPAKFGFIEMRRQYEHCFELRVEIDKCAAIAKAEGR